MNANPIQTPSAAGHRIARGCPSRRSRRGVALLVIVVLVMLVSLAAYRYTFEMESEYRLTRLQEEQTQARLAALSGIELAVAMLEAPLQQRLALEGSGTLDRAYRRNLEESSNNEGPAGREAYSGWQFALISPSQGSNANTPSLTSPLGEDTTAWTWGVENESAKLHIPTLVQWDRLRPGHFRSYLLTLPGVDEELADAWLEQLGLQSQNPRSGRGVASAMESGTSLDAGGGEHREQMDRLRMLWFGGDLNQNFQLDPFENQLTERLTRNGSSRSTTTATGIATSQSFQPLRRFLTWHSGERQERRDGLPRIFLNQPNLAQLHRELLTIMPAPMANFVIAMRQFGPGRPTREAPASAPSSGPDKATNTAPRIASSQPPPSATSNGNRPPSTPTNALSLLSNSVKQAPSIASSSAASAKPSSSSPSAGETNQSTTSRISAGSSQSMNQSPSADGATNAAGPDFTQPARYLLASPLDLIDVSVTIESAASSPGSPPNATASSKKSLTSPFSSDNGEVRNYLGMLLENTTTDPNPTREGRVDITSAPLEVLIGVPGIDLNLAQRIVQQRANATSASDQIGSIAWLLQSGAVDLTQLRALESFLTSRSDVYSVQSVGFRSNTTTTAQSPVHRVTVTIDAKQIPARIHELRVWHVWDRGFTSEALAGSAP